MYSNLIKTIHLLFVDEGFQLLGTSEVCSKSDAVLPSLPSDWNSTEDVWILCYRAPKEQYESLTVVKALKMGDTLELHMHEKEDADRVFSCEIIPKNHIDDDNKLDPFAVRRIVLNDLIKPFKEICKTKTKAEEKKEEPRRHVDLRDNHNPLRVGGPMGPGANRLPVGYGYNDLNPQFGQPGIGGFGGMGNLGGFGVNGGGGMLFDPSSLPNRTMPPPRNPYGITPGSIPDGARYDPIGPGDPHRPGLPNSGLDVSSAEPNPDHLPPPGYNNMFM
eukprot:CFRG0524T1